MATPRDIALIFLSFEAFFMALVPLILISALAYGVYRLRLLAREYLQIAFFYVEQAREAVERAAYAVAQPFIKLHSIFRMVQTILQNLVLRRST